MSTLHLNYKIKDLPDLTGTVQLDPPINTTLSHVVSSFYFVHGGQAYTYRYLRHFAQQLTREDRDKLTARRVAAKLGSATGAEFMLMGQGRGPHTCTVGDLLMFVVVELPDLSGWYWLISIAGPTSEPGLRNYAYREVEDQEFLLDNVIDTEK